MTLLGKGRRIPEGQQDGGTGRLFCRSQHEGSSNNKSHSLPETLFFPAEQAFGCG